MNKIDIIWAKCCGILGTEGTKLDAHANLFDMGLDSLGLAELVIQCEEVFGEGVITVDDIIANPIISEIAARLGGGTISAQQDVVPATLDDTYVYVSEVVPPPRAAFLFSGEGAHSANLDLTVLKTSPAWETVDQTLLDQHGQSVEAFLSAHLGVHAPPFSPVVTTVLNILQADLWKLWGRALPGPLPAPPTRSCNDR